MRFLYAYRALLDCKRYVIEMSGVSGAAYAADKCVIWICTKTQVVHAWLHVVRHLLTPVHIWARLTTAAEELIGD